MTQNSIERFHNARLAPIVGADFIRVEADPESDELFLVFGAPSGKVFGVAVLRDDEGNGAGSLSPATLWDTPPDDPRDGDRPANGYASKQQARRERLESAAARARAKQAEYAQYAEALVRGIPPGKPALVATQERYRRLIEKSQRAMARADAAGKRAEELQHRADAVGRHVSNDNPDAIELLRARLAQLEAWHSYAKSVNAAWRNEGRPRTNDIEGWGRVTARMGLPEGALERLRLDLATRGTETRPFDASAFASHRTTARRIEARILGLEAAADAVTSERQVGHVRVIENVELRRIQLVLEGTRDEETRSTLRQAGFLWAPSAGAWQRPLNASGRAAADAVLVSLGERP